MHFLPFTSKLGSHCLFLFYFWPYPWRPHDWFPNYCLLPSAAHKILFSQFKCSLKDSPTTRVHAFVGYKHHWQMLTRSMGHDIVSFLSCWVCTLMEWMMLSAFRKTQKETMTEMKDKKCCWQCFNKNIIIWEDSVKSSRVSFLSCVVSLVPVTY